MIIDTHHHVVPVTAVDEKFAEVEADHRWHNYTGGARGHGINVSREEIKKAMLAAGPDPKGEKLLARMAKAGIDLTIMCVTDAIQRGLNDDQAMALNKTYADMANASHGKIQCLASIDPRRKKAPEMLRRCIKDYGMKGLKWHCDAGYSPVSEEAYAELKVLQEFGLPLLTHTGPLTVYPPDRRRTDYCDSLLLDYVAQDFPGIKIIAAHMGRWRSRDWASVAEFRTNVFGDLAMWQTIAAADYAGFCRDLRGMIDIAGADSILFATDGPGFDTMVPNDKFVQMIKDLTKKAPAGIKFTQAEVDAILGGNAKKVFNI